MANVTKVNGGVNAPMQQVGRDVEWVSVTLADIHTGFDAVDSDLEKAYNVISGTSSVTFIGTPDSDVVMFGVEGLGATAGDIQTAIDAATGGSSTVAIVSIVGGAFA